jgi:hypothetical protein
LQQFINSKNNLNNQEITEEIAADGEATAES